MSIFKIKYFTTIVLSISISLTTVCKAQESKTANDIVPEYSAPFTFGTNLGYVSSGKWNDGATGNLAAGNEQLGIEGVGANSLRLSLPEHFLEKWGYTIRVNTYKEYARLGMSEFTAFIGYPSTEHLDDATYGASASSKLFANMYEPIWADNEDSVPVNKNNYLALYVYKMVLNYGDKVKFWEVWNEPDYTNSSAAYQLEGTADSWWTRNPTPAELVNLNALFFIISEY
ncbi:MAG: hypothetical protein IPO21_08605 [Bacteroidales bacterium]|nr:hypothetical protein [Bacteroidales bacterium]